MQEKRYDWTQFKTILKERGSGMKEWADEHGFNLKTVSALVCGRYLYFCNYGPKALAIIAQAEKDRLISEAKIAA